MIQTILIVFLSTLTVSFAIAYVTSLNQLIKVKEELTRLIFDNFAMEKIIELSSQTEEEKNENEVHKENFIKFISDSRDWAFTYIEDVQKGIGKFIQDVDSYIEYFDKYGAVGLDGPDKEAMRHISIAYKDLKNLLPKEETE